MTDYDKGGARPPMRDQSVHVTGNGNRVAAHHSDRTSVFPASIGRIVHYEHPGGGCCAAVITNCTGDDHVDLFMFPTRRIGRPLHGGELFDIPLSGPGTPATWHWPERNDA